MVVETSIFVECLLEPLKVGFGKLRAIMLSHSLLNILIFCFIFVDTYGSSKVDLSDSKIAKKIESLFDMRPAAIVERFKLKDPIYSETAAYGHMGRKSEKKTIKFEVGGGKVISKDIETFPWEKLDRVDEIRSNFGL